MSAAVIEQPPAAAVVDLLAALAYGELSAFDHLAADARMAPTLAGRTAMSTMAAVELGHHHRLTGRLGELGCEPIAAMAPFVEALDGYHALTEPSDWLESLVKAFVGDGMAADFYREVARYVDTDTATLIGEVLVDDGRAQFAVREVREAITLTPTVAGPLALWARRLVGEAISQTQHVLAQHDPLMMLLVEGTGDLSGVLALMGRVTERHEQRMTELGLTG